MFTLALCLFIAALLPIVAKGPVAVAMNKLGGYDNRHPRAQQAELKGYGARALAAHQNSFEALIMFSPAVLAAMAVGNVTSAMEMAAMIFVAARVGYILLYLADKHALRSLTWGVGVAANFFIFWQVLAGL